MSTFVEFTRQDQVPMAFHVSQIKAIERATTADCALVILYDKFEGHDYYWTLEPYPAIRDRLLAAQNDGVERQRMTAPHDTSVASRWLAQATRAAQEHLDLY